MTTKRDPVDILSNLKTIGEKGLNSRDYVYAAVDAVLTEAERAAVGHARTSSADERTFDDFAEIHRVVSRIVANSVFRAPELLWHTVNDIAGVVLRQPEIQAAMAVDLTEAIVHVEMQNDRTNWVAKPKAPLGAPTRWAPIRRRPGRVQRKIDARGGRARHYIAAVRHFHATHGRPFAD
jgi:hypothetical protein